MQPSKCRENSRSTSNLWPRQKLGDGVILHVINSLECGGTERVLVDLLRAMEMDALNGLGNDVADSYAPTSPLPRGRLRHVVVTLREAGVLAPALPETVACMSIGLGRHRRWTAGSLAQVTRQVRPAVIHARGLGCWADALAARCCCPRSRLVLGFHGTTDGKYSRRHRWVSRAALLANATFTTVGDSGRRTLNEVFAIPLNRIELLRNGVKLEIHVANESDRQAIRSELGWMSGEFIAGSVASLTAVKRQDLLIQTLGCLRQLVPQLRLLLVGDGPLRGALQDQVRSAGLEEVVRFVGFRTDVSRLLSAMDAYICSSDSECMSNSVLQAMAAGLPVIATDVGDNACVIHHGRDGLIIPTGSAPAMADALARLVPGGRADQEPAILDTTTTNGHVRRSHLARTLGFSARRRAAQFNFDDCVRRYMDFYERLAGVGYCRNQLRTPFLAA